MTLYVRNPESDTWHFCANCYRYPTGFPVVELESDERPSYGELCNECLAKEERGVCDS